MDWQIVKLLPIEMLETDQLPFKSFNHGTIAGSVGKKVNLLRKPGINEDGGLIAQHSMVDIYLLIDGHYEKDATEIMVEKLEEDISSGLWDNLTQIATFDQCSKILNDCLAYCKSLLSIFRNQNVIGEASFMILAYIKQLNRLYYFSVGDLMLFHHDPTRSWGKSYQVHNRMFYEWINRDELMGYHFGEVKAPKESKFLLATDGLMDQPTFTHEEIDHLFSISPFTAEKYVEYALETTPIEDDDNVSVICITIQ